MLKRVYVAFLTVLLCTTPVMAMTADEFLSHKAENRDIAMFVLGNAEAGGVPELLRQAKEILGVATTTTDAAMAANAKRAAFMHCAFASHLIRGLPKEEQSQHGTVLISTLAQTAEILSMSQDEMLKTLRGVSGVFNDILNPAEEEDKQQIPPTLFEKYLGEYAYVADTCGGKLVFAKGGKSGYMMSVENGCESGGTCGGDFEVMPSSESNGVVVLTDTEYGVTFAVGPKGVTVGNSLTKNICGMGAYMEGDYVRGKKAPVAQSAPSKSNTGEGGMLGKLKGSYLPGFPANEGYQTVGDSFEAFFEDPIWTLHDQLLTNVKLDGYTVAVKGIAYFNEKKVIFEVFMFWAYQEKGKKNLMFMGQDVSVNGIYMSSPEEKDFMATVMLDSKR